MRRFFDLTASRGLIFLVLLLLCQTLFSQTAPTPIDKASTPSASIPGTNTYVFPTGKERLKSYLKDSFGAGALIGSGIGATFSQIENTPPEWKKTAAGFARRFASNYGQNVIEQATLYSLSELLRQDQKYQKCRCSGAGQRAAHALRYGVLAKSRSGKDVFSLAKIVSPFVGNVAAVKLWYPKRYSVKDGLRQGAYSLGFSFGFNLIQEFIFKK